MKEFEVIFYSTANGFEPAREFLDSLTDLLKRHKKTPRKEIELAKKYRADFMERMRKGEISYD